MFGWGANTQKNVHIFANILNVLAQGNFTNSDKSSISKTGDTIVFTTWPFTTDNNTHRHSNGGLKNETLQLHVPTVITVRGTEMTLRPYKGDRDKIERDLALDTGVLGLALLQFLADEKNMGEIHKMIDTPAPFANVGVREALNVATQAATVACNTYSLTQNAAHKIADTYLNQGVQFFRMIAIMFRDELSVVETIEKLRQAIGKVKLPINTSTGSVCAPDVNDYLQKVDKLVRDECLKVYGKYTKQTALPLTFEKFLQDLRDKSATFNEVQAVDTAMLAAQKVMEAWNANKLNHGRDLERLTQDIKKGMEKLRANKEYARLVQAATTTEERQRALEEVTARMERFAREEQQRTEELERNQATAQQRHAQELAAAQQQRALELAAAQQQRAQDLAAAQQRREQDLAAAQAAHTQEMATVAAQYTQALAAAREKGSAAAQAEEARRAALERVCRGLKECQGKKGVAQMEAVQNWMKAQEELAVTLGAERSAQVQEDLRQLQERIAETRSSRDLLENEYNQVKAEKESLNTDTQKLQEELATLRAAKGVRLQELRRAIEERKKQLNELGVTEEQAQKELREALGGGGGGPPQAFSAAVLRGFEVPAGRTSLAEETLKLKMERYKRRLEEIGKNPKLSKEQKLAAAEQARLQLFGK